MANGGLPPVLRWAAAGVCNKLSMHQNSKLAVISKAHAAFDVTQAASGIVSVDLDATDTNQTTGQYIAELKITTAASAVYKSADMKFYVIAAVAV